MGVFDRPPRLTLVFFPQVLGVQIPLTPPGSNCLHLHCESITAEKKTDIFNFIGNIFSKRGDNLKASVSQSDLRAVRDLIPQIFL